MATSSRWSPTPEQLHALEEIYQSGTRTPSTNQIQQIALKLGWFGRIEGKNVFYWFQNHKARERQKHRRQQQLNSSSLTKEQQLRVDTESFKRKIPGLTGFSRTCFEVGQKKNWPVTPSNFSTLSDESLSIIPTAVVAENETNDIIQFEGRELQQKSNTSCSIIAKPQMEFSSIPPTTKAQNLNILTSNRENAMTPEDEGEYQTLELFPLWNDDRRIIIPKVSTNDSVPIKTKSNKFTPIQFFEFLPLKN